MGILNPTIGIYAISFGIFCTNIIFAFRGVFEAPAALLLMFSLQTLLVIVLFTVLHDAVHRSVSRKTWLNDAILHSLWIVFLNAPQVFKFIHLTHHVHTNKEVEDPDHFTSSSTWAGRWMRSFALIFFYYYFAAMRFPKTLKYQGWNFLSVSALLAVIVFCYGQPEALALFGVWVLPAFVGIGFLGFLNTAWPHAPGKETSRIKNTKILLVPAPLRWLLLNQNYHLIHHLRPNIPWYDYPAYWATHRDRLLQEGAEVVDYRLRSFQNQKSACKQGL